MTERLSDSARAVGWSSLFVLVAVGVWLGLAGSACDRGVGGEAKEGSGSAEQGSSEPNETEETTESGGEETEAQSEHRLPGDEKPGSREPASPGPSGPGILFLAGLKGYLEPCGCTADVLLGGAERVAGYIAAARAKYTGSAVLDAGDTFFESKEVGSHEVPQQEAKSKVVASMLREIGIAVTVPGERDFALGAEFYRGRLEESGMQALGANISVDGVEVSATETFEVGEWKLGVVGAVQPSLYDGVEGVETSPLAGAVEESASRLRGAGVDAVLLLLHGDLKTAKEQLDADAGVDFAIVGHGPRETDQVDAVGDGYTLEAYDQGRYVGALKLFGHARDRPFENSQTGSEAELEKVETQIEHVDDSLDRLPPKSAEDAPPIRERLRERLEKLQNRREKIRTSDLQVSEEHKSFLYRPVAMKPGYPIDEDVRDLRVSYNQRLEELSKEADRSVPPPEGGEATYVGTEECATCHTEAHSFWKETRHAGAFETLEERNKEFDPSCVGCHVVGYEEPGGSVVGKWEYEAEVEGRKVTKKLKDVGCETCHGPGSKHMAAPVDDQGAPQHIEREPGRSACMDCHVEEHSPRFEFDSYVESVTGPGHERSK